MSKPWPPHDLTWHAFSVACASAMHNANHVHNGSVQRQCRPRVGHLPAARDRNEEGCIAPATADPVKSDGRIRCVTAMYILQQNM